MMVVLCVLVLWIRLIMVVLFLLFSEVVGLLRSRIGQLIVKLWVMLICCCLLLEKVDGVRCYRCFGMLRWVRSWVVFVVFVLCGVLRLSSGCIIIFSVEMCGIICRNWLIQLMVVLCIFSILCGVVVIRFIYLLLWWIWIWLLFGR